MRVALLAAAALVLAAGCSQAPSSSSSPVVPERVEQVEGIWRNIHQGLLELHRNGRFELVTTITGPVAGRYDLRGGHLVFRTAPCGSAEGRYQAEVNPKRRLLLSDPDDPCLDRRRVLAGDPWIFANS